MKFASGSGTVLANLPNYVCVVLTDGKEVISVAYRYPTVDHDVLDKVAYLQAQVATISNVGAFRIEGNSESEIKDNARRFASVLRTEKVTDPTLAIYASYAYSQANLASEVDSIVTEHEQRYSLFDVSLLAGRLSKQGEIPFVTPFCPMLTQGWGMLEVFNFDTPQFLREAMRNLNDSLWTSFNSRGIEIILDEHSVSPSITDMPRNFDQRG